MEHEGLPSIASCMNASLRAPLLFEPGERWEYGIGIDWAGKIVESVSGRKLERYLQDEFFGPLEMRDTSFLLRDDMNQRLVAATQRQPDGAIAHATSSSLRTPTSTWAAEGSSRRAPTTCVSRACCSAAAPSTARACSPGTP
jgi:CubicO group peptidase (beta-lactamase class C family)